ncbi:MAG: hypothetical protein JWO86_8610 [Myxococcaceae bacterium]|nr:hypothetical protein [Myxococcaceae bacterium]MEA2751607.1 hypothetical protein [Myxococcales bacterium]
MLCAAHPEIEARGPCAVCFKNLCGACATYELDGASCCERCGRTKEDDGNALSSGLLALIAVGYLAALAGGIVLFKARPFVGGLAAIVAIALGRLMQLLVKAPVVTRRMSSASAPAPSVDATAPPL